MAFDQFDPQKIASYMNTKIEKLMQNSGIIRNRRKIEAAITNAKAFLHIQEEFGSFDTFIWNFIDETPIINHWQTVQQIPSTSPLSATISKELKDRGFKFVGATTIYAYMQATGMVNDHLINCFRHKEVQCCNPAS
jgi:DNA-3-methyladenine glycosylase I